MKKQAGYAMSLTAGEDNADMVFWSLQKLIFLGYDEDYGAKIAALEDVEVSVEITSGGNSYKWMGRAIGRTNAAVWNIRDTVMYDGSRNWHKTSILVTLAHELHHGYQDHFEVKGGFKREWVFPGPEWVAMEEGAVMAENHTRYWLYSKVPGFEGLLLRPAYGWSNGDRTGQWSALRSHLHPNVSWDRWSYNLIPRE